MSMEWSEVEMIFEGLTIYYVYLLTMWHLFCHTDANMYIKLVPYSLFLMPYYKRNKEWEVRVIPYSLFNKE